MFSTTRGIVFLAIIFGLAGLFQIGCNRNGSENPVAAISGTDSATNNANVSFKLVFPPKDSGIKSANIVPSMNTGAVVSFQVKLLNYGNTSNPYFIVSKQVPVVNGSASAIFESLPTTTILGQIHIENGKVQGYSDFHGALDLVQGENLVELAPVGSLMHQDVVAKALSEIISSSTLFLKAPQALVSELDRIVSVLLLDSSTAYEEVINNFTNRNGVPVIELVSPTANQAFAAGDNIALIASATDIDGNISKVEFFQGTNKVGEAMALPFFCTWKPLSAGSYSLTAKAFDNNLAVGVTSPVVIQVISKETSVTYTVLYNGNGNAGGSVPTDNLTYEQNAIVTVKDNSGSLVKTGYTFAGWNTAADGSGTSYNPAATFNIGSANVTLYAKWSLVPTYTITYNGNGNTGGSVPTDNLTYQQNATVTVKDNSGSLVKTGYTFAGWNTAADGSGISYNPAATFSMGAANVTLYAKWSLVPTYTITYNGNGNTGGSAPTDNLTYQQNTTVTVKDNADSLVKTGYTFAGWNTAADGSGISYNPASTFSMGAANVTLYAKWSLVPTYTITYNGNGNTGGSVPTDNLTYQQSATVTVKDNVGSLVKTGYTFAGWNNKSDGSGQDYLANSTFPISGDIVLYAKWQSSLYSWSSGSATVSDTNFALGRPTATYTGTSYSSESAVDGNPMTRWSGNRDDLGPDESNPHFLIVDLQQIREVRSIKVNIAGWDSWKQNFSIYTSADLQSWSLVASEQDKTGILSYNLQPINIRYVKFSSTYSADNGQVNLYELEVYGTEQAVNTYTVTYNGNGNAGGSAPTDNLTYEQNAIVTVKDNAGSLVKTGYTFAGWNTAADGSGNSYSPATTFNMGSANVTLYAKWSPITTYTITYDGNGSTGGSVPTDNLTYQQNATVAVKDNAGSLVKTGYTFAGWNTAADGSGTSYNPASAFSMGSANVTLYAKWSPIPIYTVIYNGNGNDGGEVPIDTNTYLENSSVVAKANIGNLTKFGSFFDGWNTASDGGGVSYQPNDSFLINNSNKVLYAVFKNKKIADISAGPYCSMGLSVDGEVLYWGYSLASQSPDVHKPSDILGLREASSISVGNTHFFVSKTSGDIFCGGRNGWGELGLGFTGGNILGGGHSVTKMNFPPSTQISCGSSYSMFKLFDGSVWGCGRGDVGVIGAAGALSQQVNPIQVIIEDVATISAGTDKTFFIKTDGTVWACGSNQNGDLGDGTRMNRRIPVQVLNLTNVVSVSSNESTTFAVKDDGSLWGWGYNGLNLLDMGNDPVLSSTTIPIQINTISGVKSVHCGSASVFCLKTDGTVWAWGYNQHGQIGNGTFNNPILAPSQVINLDHVVELVVGSTHVLALKNDGTVWAWGENQYGQVGNNTTTDIAQPVLISW